MKAPFDIPRDVFDALPLLERRRLEREQVAARKRTYERTARKTARQPDSIAARRAERREAWRGRSLTTGPARPR